MQLFWHWDTFEYICLFCSPFLLFCQAIQQLSDCFPSINRDFAKLEQLKSMALRFSCAWFKLKRTFRQYGGWHHDKSPDGLISLVWAVWQLVACFSFTVWCCFLLLEWRIENLKTSTPRETMITREDPGFHAMLSSWVAAKQWELVF